MEACETVELAMASAEPFGDDRYILDRLRDNQIQQLEQLAPDLPGAGELLGAVAHSPTSDHRRLFAETTLRSAIGHAHAQLTSVPSRGPRPLRLTDCTAILRAAAAYVSQGGTDTPLQDGSLVALGPKPHHGWIWRDEHPNDAYATALRKLVMDRYRLLPTTPDAHGVETMQTGARLLEELLPSLAPSALHHAHVIACAPTAGVFTSSDSSSRPDLGGMFFLRQSLLSNPWRVAEHLLHESIHLKLYDFVVGDILTPSEGRFVERPVIVPWRPSRLCGDNRWHAGRVLAAFHVYVHLALLSTVAERRAPELEARYGPASGIVESGRARARARYLGHQLRAHASCWDRLGPAGRELVGWLQSLLDILDPAPPPDCCTLALYLYRYQTESDRLEQVVAEPTEQRPSLRQGLAALARQDVASSRAILRDLDAHRQLAKLDTAVARFTDIELADSYPEIRRVINTCLVDASLDGHRMSESGVHDAMVGEMVDSASDALFALTAGIPAAVAHAKRRAVERPAVIPCHDSVGRLLAVQAAHLPPGAKILEIGAGVGIVTAWLVAGLGSRTDVELLSVEPDETLSATARSYDWPRYVRIETADAKTVLVGHPGTFDLIRADASASSFDHFDAIVGAARPGSMLIFVQDAISAAASAPEDTPLSALRRTALGHDQLVAVDLDWSGGLLIAAKRR